jgi:large subunit ribosomal protein L19
VHQKVREGNKERIQIFEGVVIKVSRKNSLTSSITVRRIASGVGVEKTYLLHSPLVLKVEVMRRSRVRRNYLSYLRQRSGKSARLNQVAFDKEKVNKIADIEAEAELEQIKEEIAEKHESGEYVSDAEEAAQAEKEAEKK